MSQQNQDKATERPSDQAEAQRREWLRKIAEIKRRQKKTQR